METPLWRNSVFIAIYKILQKFCSNLQWKQFFPCILWFGVKVYFLHLLFIEESWKKTMFHKNIKQHNFFNINNKKK